MVTINFNYFRQPQKRGKFCNKLVSPSLLNDSNKVKVLTTVSSCRVLKNVLPTLEKLKTTSDVEITNYLKVSKGQVIVSDTFKEFIDYFPEITFISKEFIQNASLEEFEAYQKNYLALLPSQVLLVVEHEEKRLLRLWKQRPNQLFVSVQEESYFKDNGVEGAFSHYDYNVCLFPQIQLKDALFRVQIIKRVLMALINHILHLARFFRYAGLVSVLSFQLYNLFNDPKADSNFRVWSLAISTFCSFRNEKLPLDDFLIMIEVDLIDRFFNEQYSLRPAKKLIAAKHNEVFVSELILHSARNFK